MATRKNTQPTDAAFEIRQLRQRLRAPIIGHLIFAAPKKASQGFVVRFSTVPRVGDGFSIDQDSVKALDDEKLHVTEWKVIDVTHDVQLVALPTVDDETGAEPLLPETSLRVTVHPKTRGGLSVA